MTDPHSLARMAGMTSTIELPVGTGIWQLRVRTDAAVALEQAVGEDPVVDSRAAIMAALDAPFGFASEAPLRRSVTPDDRVVIVLDEHLPHIGELLAGLVAHLGKASIAPAAITVVVPSGGRSKWVDDLPDEFADIKLEVHDSEDKTKLAYLATTKSGRRVYLNRTMVEAECVIVLSGRGFDPTFGYGGAEASLFPILSDPDSMVEFVGRFDIEPPGEKLPGTRREPHEVSKLLSPYYVQVIEGAGDSIREIVAGLNDSTSEGVRRQNARWRMMIEDRPDLVIAAVSGSPERVSYREFAAALACAARVVQAEGRIVLLTSASPPLEEGAELLRRMGDPHGADAILAKRKPDDWPAAARWAFSAQQASLFISCGWSDELIEELFGTPVHDASEVQRLIDAAERTLIIPDAHKTVVEMR